MNTKLTAFGTKISSTTKKRVQPRNEVITFRNVAFILKITLTGSIEIPYKTTE